MTQNAPKNLGISPFDVGDFESIYNGVNQTVNIGKHTYVHNHQTSVLFAHVVHNLAVLQQQENTYKKKDSNF